LGLPNLVPLKPVFGADDDTEDLDPDFFTADDDFATEETEAWTEEDEKELAQFATGRKRGGGGRLLIGLALFATLIFLPLSLLALSYLQPKSPALLPVVPEATEIVEAVETKENIKDETTETETETITVTDELTDTAKVKVEPVAPKEQEANPSPAKAIKTPQTPKSAAAMGTRSVSGWIKEGWRLVDSGGHTKAAKSFRQALDLDPSHFEANYGYGYAMLKQGDPAEARHYLCIASGSNDRSTQTEVLAILRRNGMSCN